MLYFYWMEMICSYFFVLSAIILALNLIYLYIPELPNYLLFQTSNWFLFTVFIAMAFSSLMPGLFPLHSVDSLGTSESAKSEKLTGVPGFEATHLDEFRA